MGLDVLIYKRRRSVMRLFDARLLVPLVNKQKSMQGGGNVGMRCSIWR